MSVQKSLNTLSSTPVKTFALSTLTSAAMTACDTTVAQKRVRRRFFDIEIEVFPFLVGVTYDQNVGSADDQGTRSRIVYSSSTAPIHSFSVWLPS
jgi:hypothetical protein